MRAGAGHRMSTLVPIAQVVAEFGISRSMLYELIKAGRLSRYRKLGEKRTLLDRREVRRLLEPRKVK